MSQIKVWLGKPYPLGATWRGNGINFALYWSSDRAPDRPLHDTVVYEVHVKGFSKLCPHIPEKIRGSYAGLGSSWAIDYSTNLGITAVELMPVHQFVDDKILVDRGLRNYWGYNSMVLNAHYQPVKFFFPAKKRCAGSSSSTRAWKRAFWKARKTSPPLRNTTWASARFLYFV